MLVSREGEKVPFLALVGGLAREKGLGAGELAKRLAGILGGLLRPRPGSGGSHAAPTIRLPRQRTQYGAAASLTSCALRMNSPNCWSDASSSRIE